MTEINKSAETAVEILKRHYDNCSKNAMEEYSTINAIEFGEWLKTFEALSRENGQWVIESQIETKELYRLFLKSTNARQNI